MRILLGSPEDVTASFHSSFINVLSLSEQLSFQETRRSIVWIGPDAAMIRCGSIDFANKVYTYFSTDLIPRMAPTDEGPDGNFIIAISEFCSFISFLILRGKCLGRQLVAYTGDNSNAITWLTFRRSGNERARLLLGILARFEQSLEFRTYPLYISTLNNIECGNLTRLSESTIPEYDSSENWIFAGPIHIFKFDPSDSFPGVSQWYLLTQNDD